MACGLFFDSHQAMLRSCALPHAGTVRRTFSLKATVRPRGSWRSQRPQRFCIR